MQKRVSKMENMEFALAWKEEQEKLQSYAAGVPEKGTIVEIGTGLGGTANSFGPPRGTKILAFSPWILLHFISPVRIWRIQM